ncbi:MAG: MGMT family protein [Candidatus Bathyarchaeia archaeon]
MDDIWLAASTSHGAVVGCAFSRDRDEALSSLKRKLGGIASIHPSCEYRRDRLASLAVEAMRRRIMGLNPEEAPPLDLSRLPRFSRRVLEAVSRIPRGCVSTYGDVASFIGCVKGCRAVGTALRNNPLPLLIPCHRVVKSDLTIGGYTALGGEGVAFKRRLLEMEGVKFRGERVSSESLWRLEYEGSR